MMYFEHLAEITKDLFDKLMSSVIKMNQGSLEITNSFSKLLFSHLEEKNKKENSNLK